MNNLVAMSEMVSYLKEVQENTRNIRDDVHKATNAPGHENSPYYEDRVGLNRSLLKDSLNEGNWKKVYDVKGRLL